MQYTCGYLFISGPHTGVIFVQNYGHFIFIFLNGNVKKKPNKKQVKAHPGHHLLLGINSCALKEDPQMN